MIILDVGISMSTPKKQAKDDAPPLEGALKAVNILIQQKVSNHCTHTLIAFITEILFGKSDEVGLVLCGTEGIQALLSAPLFPYYLFIAATDNPLSEDGYEHITVARELTSPDIDLLHFVEKIGPSKHTGDCIYYIYIPLCYFD